jgi:hypothetical protein
MALRFTFMAKIWLQMLFRNVGTSIGIHVSPQYQLWISEIAASYCKCFGKAVEIRGGSNKGVAKTDISLVVTLCTPNLNIHQLLTEWIYVFCIDFKANRDLICVWPCIINVGKVNMELQLDATITVLLISMISSTCLGQTFAHLQERRT